MSPAGTLFILLSQSFCHSSTPVSPVFGFSTGVCNETMKLIFHLKATYQWMGLKVNPCARVETFTSNKPFQNCCTEKCFLFLDGLPGLCCHKSNPKCKMIISITALLRKNKGDRAWELKFPQKSRLIHYVLANTVKCWMVP